MPAVVAVGAMVAGSAATAYAVGAGFVVAGSIGAAVVGGLASTAASMVLTKALGLDAGSLPDTNTGISVNTASTVDPVRIIYGRMRWGGTLVYIATSGDDNVFLNLVIVHCEGGIASIGQLYLDNTPINDPKFAGKVYYETYTNGGYSAALGAQCPEWDSTHTLNGLAYSYVRLNYDRDTWTGIPTITADISGRLCYDPRDGLTKETSNPALCVLDYLTNATFGRNLPTASIHTASFIAAANICEQTFVDTAGTGRYLHTCNGIISPDDDSLTNIRKLLSPMRALLVFSARGYSVIPDTAAVPTLAFSEDNITGSWRISVGGKRSKYNRVQADWINPDNEYQADIYTADSTTYRAADNGLLLESQITLPMTNNPFEAQILAERHLRQSRFCITCTFRATIAGMVAEVGDVVTVTHSTPGWVAKPFRVLAMRLQPDDEVELDLIEYDDAVYAPHPLTAPRTTSPTGLDNWTPRIVALTAAEELVESVTGVHSVVNVAWTTGVYYDRARLRYRVDAGDWVRLNDVFGYSTSFTVPDGTHRVYVEVTPVNIKVGSPSYVSLDVYGKTAPPADVADLAGNLSDRSLIITYRPTDEADVRVGGALLLRFAPVQTGATWDNAQSLAQAPGNSSSVTVPAVSGAYLAKWQDSSGNLSANPMILYSQANGAIGMYQAFAADEANNAFPWGGDDINIVRYTGSRNGIRLDDTALQGVYMMFNSYDAGTVYTMRIMTNVLFTTVMVNDYVDGWALWDSITDVDAVATNAPYNLMDGWVTADGRGAWDGLPVGGGSVTCQYSTSQDGVIWSEWSTAQAAFDVRCRLIYFRLLLRVDRPDINVDVTNAQFTVSLAGRVEKGNDIAVPAAGLTVYYTSPFNTTPAVTILSQGLMTGDYHLISSKNRFGFTLQFLNSAGAGVARTFDYIAQGV